MGTAFATATDRFGQFLGQHVIVEFEDGHQEAGMLETTGWDVIQVLHTYGAGHQHVAQYALVGDEDTPGVVSMVLDQAQAEALAGPDPLF